MQTSIGKRGCGLDAGYDQNIKPDVCIMMNEKQFYTMLHLKCLYASNSTVDHNVQLNYICTKLNASPTNIIETSKRTGPS